MPAHCLRHTFVYMTRETMTPKEVQAVLGHDESATTLDIYGDIINDSTIKTAAKIVYAFSKVEFEIEKIENPTKKKKGRGKSCGSRGNFENWG